MAKIKFTLDESEMRALVKMIEDYEEGAEKRLNDYIHKEAKDLFVLGITNRIPKSYKKKKHAKDEKWETHRSYNLAVVIGFSKQYNYLYFPETGSGRTSKNGAQLFLEEGVESKMTEVSTELVDLLMPY